MKSLRWVLLGIAGVIVVLIAVIVIRTETFEPPAAADLSGVRLAPHARVDAQAAAQHLSQALRFRTVSNQNAADNDWPQWDAMRTWLAVTYPMLHTTAKVETAAQHTLVYTWAGSDASLAPIILMAHQDVVPVSAGTEKDWRHPPFSGAIAEGAVWGRGAYDNKGPMIGLLEAVESLMRAGFKPKRTIYVVLPHNEEVKGDGAETVARVMKARGVKAEWLLDEGPFIEMDEPITGGAVAKIAIAEKGYADIRITARGAGGHSSRPPPETAVATLARAVLAVADNPFERHIGAVTREQLAILAPKTSWMNRMRIANLWATEHWVMTDFSATPTGDAQLHTTIAPTMLQGSPKANVLPQVATAVINFRIDPESNTGEVMAHVKDSVGDLPVTLDFDKTSEPVPASSTTSEGWKAIAALAHDMSGAPVVPDLFLASTDSSRFVDVARDIYRFVPAPFPRTEVGTMMHGTNEHMTVKNLEGMIDFYSRLIRMTAG